MQKKYLCGIAVIATLSFSITHNYDAVPVQPAIGTAPSMEKADVPPDYITPSTRLFTLNETQREDLLNAMQRQEGWRPGTTSWDGNNPGNINFGVWARSHGATGARHGIAIFPSYALGRSAMKALVFGVYGRRTMIEMLAGDPARGIRGYAPATVDQFGHRGNPSLYARHVAKWMNDAGIGRQPRK